MLKPPLTFWDLYMGRDLLREVAFKGPVGLHW